MQKCSYFGPTGAFRENVCGLTALLQLKRHKSHFRAKIDVFLQDGEAQFGEINASFREKGNFAACRRHD
jgi:hypothetical protein